ncbi:hypothetical protein ACLOJK_036881 [Asimina triloba]
MERKGRKIGKGGERAKDQKCRGKGRRSVEINDEEEGMTTSLRKTSRRRSETRGKETTLDRETRKGDGAGIGKQRARGDGWAEMQWKP